MANQKYPDPTEAILSFDDLHSMMMAGFTPVQDGEWGVMIRNEWDADWPGTIAAEPVKELPDSDLEQVSAGLGKRPQPVPPTPPGPPPDPGPGPLPYDPFARRRVSR